MNTKSIEYCYGFLIQSLKIAIALELIISNHRICKKIAGKSAAACLLPYFSICRIECNSRLKFADVIQLAAK